MHKKQFFKIGIAVVVIVALAGVSAVFMKNGHDLKSASLGKDDMEINALKLKDLSLNLDDLIQGYDVYNEYTEIDYAGDDYVDADYMGEEYTYYVFFEYSGLEPECYTDISLTIEKCDSSDIATKRLNDSKEFFSLSVFNATEIDEKIGEECFIVQKFASYHWKNSTSRLETSILFKISDYFCVMDWGQWNNFDYLFGLAKIMEKKIYDEIRVQLPIQKTISQIFEDMNSIS